MIAIDLINFLAVVPDFNVVHFVGCLGLETKWTGEETFVEPGEQSANDSAMENAAQLDSCRYSDRQKSLRGRVDADEVILSGHY